jgi:hypothetical protein
MYPVKFSCPGTQMVKFDPLSQFASWLPFAWLDHACELRTNLTGSNHVRTFFREWLNFVVEVIQDSIILLATIGQVERLDISALFLLDPGIGICNVANYNISAGENERVVGTHHAR